jgi:hypothetical protein
MLWPSSRDGSADAEPADEIDQATLIASVFFSTTANVSARWWLG